MTRQLLHNAMRSPFWNVIRIDNFDLKIYSSSNWTELEEYLEDKCVPWIFLDFHSLLYVAILVPNSITDTET